jgi:NAD(P)-dependent dehydrogenase (short-subunit alcohol dehydrogenase family)
METDMIALKGKRALVTGGTTGLGRSVALQLGQQGCRVFIGGRDPDHLEKALGILRDAGCDAGGSTSDLAHMAGVLDLFQAADAWLGGLDIAILNAGLGAHGKLVNMSHEHCREVVNVNLLSMIHGALEALRRMKGKGGQIVMTGSMSAEVFDAEAAVYTATKSAIRGFAGSLRKEANPDGVRVSLIEPGSMGTDMVDESEEEKQRMKQELKMLDESDVARAIVFILRQPERCDVIQVQVRPRLQLI